jgi:hypothetical protein
MFPGGLPKCFEFILGSDDFSRPFGEGERGNDRHYPGEGASGRRLSAFAARLASLAIVARLQPVAA